MTKPNTQTLTQLPREGKLRWRQLEPFMPISRELARRLSVEGKFPPRIRYGLRCTFWDAQEIHRWLQSPADYTAPPKPTKPQPTPEA